MGTAIGLAGPSDGVSVGGFAPGEALWRCLADVSEPWVA